MDQDDIEQGVNSAITLMTHSRVIELCRNKMM